MQMILRGDGRPGPSAPGPVRDESSASGPSLSSEFSIKLIELMQNSCPKIRATVRLGFSAHRGEGSSQEGSIMDGTILEEIGRTPLVRLQRVASGVQAAVCAKMESLNPGGSIKDRVGLAMVEEAERRGWLRPGGTIVEATAGNTGVGLAMVAAVRG